MQITHLKKTYAIIFHHLQYSSYDTSNMKTKVKKKNKNKQPKTRLLFHVIRLVQKSEG